MRPTELVDGDLVEAPSPSYWHQEVLSRLVMALRAWAASHPEPVTVVQAPMDVRFAPDRILQPDAMVFLAALDRDITAPIQRIPELCIEVVFTPRTRLRVLSSNRTYDRVTKRFMYAEAGVAEYWIVDPAGVVERCTGPGLVRREQLDDRLSSALLPGFELDVGELLGR
jgi:Uma2 family endonuclease